MAFLAGAQMVKHKVFTAVCANNVHQLCISATISECTVEFFDLQST